MDFSIFKILYMYVHQPNCSYAFCIHVRAERLDDAQGDILGFGFQFDSYRLNTFHGLT